MPNKEPTKSEALTELALEDRILDLTLRGVGINDIATTLGVSRKAVSEHLDKWLVAFQEDLAEKAEMLGLLELGRLDFIYRQVLPYALPREGADGAKIPPDRGLLGVVLKIVAEKREWVKLRQTYIAPASKDESEAYDKIVPTFTSGSDMYKKALHNLSSEAHWSDDADIPVDDLFRGDTKVVEEYIASNSEEEPTDEN